MSGTCFTRSLPPAGAPSRRVAAGFVPRRQLRRSCLYGGAGADLVRDLTRQELTVAERGREIAVLDDNLAAQDRRARPGGDLVALPGRVVGLVQIRGADRAAGARVEQHDIGVGADRERALARVKSHDLCRVRGDKPDEIVEAVTANAAKIMGLY